MLEFPKSDFERFHLGTRLPCTILIDLDIDLAGIMAPLSTLHQSLVDVLYPGHAGDEPTTTLQDRQRAWRAAFDAPSPPTEEGLAVRAQLADLDQSLIQALTNEGYLPHAFPVRVRTLQSRMRATYNVVTADQARIALATDDQGKISPIVPTAGPHQMTDRVSLEAVSHWAVLLHEAAHATLSLESHPFGSIRLDAATNQALNLYLLGPLGDGRGYFQRVFHEAFADAYGLMLLSVTLGDHPGVDQEVTNVHWARAQIRVHDLDAHLAKRKVVMNAPHLTEWAIERMWNDRKTWQGQPPAQMKTLALTYASEGLLDAILPGRALEIDGTLDDRLVNYLGREMKAHLTHGYAAAMVVQDLVNPQDSRLDQWVATYPDHVGLKGMKLAADKMHHQAPPNGPYAHLEPSKRKGAAAAYLDRALGRGVLHLAQKSLETTADQVMDSLRLAPTPWPKWATAKSPSRRGPR